MHGRAGLTFIYSSVLHRLASSIDILIDEHKEIEHLVVPANTLRFLAFKKHSKEAFKYHYNVEYSCENALMKWPIIFHIFHV